MCDYVKGYHCRVKNLLPYWNQPPKALLLFMDLPKIDKTNLEYWMDYAMQFLNFGGPLPLGSDIYLAVYEIITDTAKRFPETQWLLHDFQLIHSKLLHCFLLFIWSY
jgi:hypothetical protein